MVEEAQIIVHKADQPDLIRDLLDADFLASEDGAEVDFLPPEADPAALGDGDGPVVERVLEVRESAIGSCRGPVQLSGIPHAKSLVRPFVVVQAHDETPMVPKLSFRTGGTPGTKGQPGSCGQGRRDLSPFSM